MNKVLTVSCLAGILISGLTLGAHASSTQWNLKFQGTSGLASVPTVGQNLGTTILPDSNGNALALVSTLAGVADDESVRDTKDGGLAPNPQGFAAQAGWFRPSWTKNDGTDNPGWPWMFQNDYKLPLATAVNDIKTWNNLVLWATPGYTDPLLHLYVTAATGVNTPPVTGSVGQPVVYKLIMTFHPAGYAGPTEFLLPPSATGGFIADIALPSAGAVLQNPMSGAQQVGGYGFQLVTPEPGSILALGAGLAGLAGMIRRRR